ncbi:MAG: Asp/Glu racemase [Caldilineaceae bacterium SB0661_bin_34]|nr:Asp/Glu racemase [Caldilineaceae bacterium SB0661_bin_34]
MMTVPDLVQLPFDTDDGFGSRARIGLIVLESDQTIEAEARMLNLPAVSFYHSRVPNSLEVTSETLTDMEQWLPAAAALLPRDFGFDAIGYGCTSAAALIGADRVAAAIRSEHPGVACTNPITAAVAALGSLDAHRVAVVTPYTAEVTEPIARSLADAGLSLTALGSFVESNDLTVGRISPESVAAGVRTMARSADCDAVFVSCTSLRLLASVEDLESEVGVPVLSSNMALFWHVLRLAGVADRIDGLGRIFTRRLAAG